MLIKHLNQEASMSREIEGYCESSESNFVKAAKENERFVRDEKTIDLSRDDLRHIILYAKKQYKRGKNMLDDLRIIGGRISGIDSEYVDFSDIIHWVKKAAEAIGIKHEAILGKLIECCDPGHHFRYTEFREPLIAKLRDKEECSNIAIAEYHLKLTLSFYLSEISLSKVYEKIGLITYYTIIDLGEPDPDVLPLKK